MRYGVLADIHGNLHALHAVLGVLVEERIDGYLCLGDLVGYGPFPNECVAAVAALGATAVAGNHELITQGLLPDAHCSPLARTSLQWTRSVLAEKTYQYLAKLPRTATVAGAVLAHGSPEDPQEYVRSADRADDLLGALPPAATLLLGHTHEPWAYARGGRTLLRGGTGTVALKAGTAHLLNPGSVGQSRDRSCDARFLILDLAERRADFRAVAYDVRGCRAALRKAGLPDRSHHIRPPGRLRRALR